MNYDKIIIGAGLYGLYSALLCGKQGERILVLEKDSGAFMRATYINQARVHMGYHYPRSYSTAIKSAGYFERFNKDYSFSIHTDFEKIYAISKNFSWTNGEQFEKFCEASKIKCDSISPNIYFKDKMCDGTYITEEYTYDAQILKDYFLNEIIKNKNIEIKYSVDIDSIVEEKEMYKFTLSSGEIYTTEFVINSTYASVNQIHEMLGFEPFKIKYELCELIICKTNDKLKNKGITVMDGPFFSIMPFGKTGYHSLTSVTFTPHMTSYDKLPTFDCQRESKGYCSKEKLGNCNNCPAKPKSAWPFMSNLAKKYLKDEFEFEYVDSYFSMKPILMASEIDDSRPTVIKVMNERPKFISVLSGKINTVYDLEEVILNGKK